MKLQHQHTITPSTIVLATVALACAVLIWRVGSCIAQGQDSPAGIIRQPVAGTAGAVDGGGRSVRLP